MILGYEQPVSIPGMEIYDKDTMRMYLSALLRDYEQGLADLKEYLKSIGDFYSPSSKDNQNWFNMTMAPIQQFLALNPNAIRSVQGRAEIARLINSRPYELMAQLRAGAENMKEYQKNLNAMVAAGKMDAETARLLDGDFSNYDSLGPNGVWNKTAPTAQKTINEVLAPYIEDLAKRGYEDDLVKSKQKGEGWLVRSVSDDKIYDQIGRHSVDILNDPMMQLRIRQSGMTPEEYLNSEIFRHMRSELPDQSSENKVWMDLQTLDLKRNENAIHRAQLGVAQKQARNQEIQIYLSAGYQLDDKGRLVKPNTPTVPLSAHQETDNASVSKRNSFLGGGSDGGNAKAFNDRLDEYIAYYSNLMNDKNWKNRAARNVKWATRVKKEGFQNAVKNGLFTKNKYGDYVPTASWNDAYTKVQTNSAVTKPLYNEATNKAISYRNTYKNDIADDGHRKTAANRFAGSSTIDKNITAGDGVQNRKVSLAKESIMFTPYRAQYVAGVTKGKGFRDKDSNIARKFNDYVHKNQLTAFYTNDSYSKMSLVSSPRTRGGRSFEIDAPILISGKDIKAFAKHIGRPDEVESIARELGLVPKTLQNKSVVETGKNAGKQAWINADYYEADFTRIENNNNTNSAGAYDYDVDKNRYGQTNATKYVITREAQSAYRK